MQLSHFSNRKLTLGRISNSGQMHPDDLWGFKPLGLWVSVDGEDDWEQWCVREKLSYLGSQRYRVTLKPRHRLLIVEGLKQLKEFTEEYQFEVAPNSLTSDAVSKLLSRGRSFVRSIDWREVAKRYRGIIIAPYIWQIRLNSNYLWYYPWDVASGCIWDRGAIQSIRKLRWKKPTT